MGDAQLVAEWFCAETRCKSFRCGQLLAVAAGLRPIMVGPDIPVEADDEGLVLHCDDAREYEAQLAVCGSILRLRNVRDTHENRVQLAALLVTDATALLPVRMIG